MEASRVNIGESSVPIGGLVASLGAFFRGGSPIADAAKSKSGHVGHLS